MTRLNMVRTAIEVLREGATADQVVRYVSDLSGEAIDARFVPVCRATLRAEEELRRARERAADILAADRQT